MQVVIYRFGSEGQPFVGETYEADNITQARNLVRAFFETERICFNTNIRKAWITASGTEAHIYGFGRDEHVAIIIEEDDTFDYMTQEWYENDIYQEEPEICFGQE